MAARKGDDSFFNHLRQYKTCHILVTAETDDFDALVLDDWRGEGFSVTYLAFGDGGAEFVRRLQGVADKAVGVSERYAIIAFGAPGAPLLTSLRYLPRLCAMVAYYPPQIPSPQHVTYPPGVSVLLHLCAGSNILVSRRPEVLGLQGGKIRTTQKQIESGAGLGGGIDLGQKGLAELRTYVYESVSPGFAESDVDAFDSVTKDHAWSRSLAMVRKAFGNEEPDLERIRDAFFDDAGTDPDGSRTGWAQALPEDDVSRINLPTLTGGFDREGLRAFYRDLFGPTAHLIRAKLISRTVGSTQVVDEMVVSFKHDAVIQWMLPRVPPTGKNVSIPVVSIVAIKAGRCVSERLYWDQASVLVQIGMLDPSLIAKGFAPKNKNKDSHKNLRLPIVDDEQARAVELGEDWDGSVNTLVDGMRNSSIS